RIQAASIYPVERTRIAVNKEEFIRQVHDALYFTTVISYVQGMAMLHRASAEWDMQIPLPEVVRVWRGGCIIRSVLLDVFGRAYQRNPRLANLLLDSEVAALLK